MKRDALRATILAIVTTILASALPAQTRATRPPARPTTVDAEPLYLPRAVKLAFKNGTRTLDGKPGAHYWQNRARYAMTIDVAPPASTVRGVEEIEYFNDSPDTLRALTFKLFMNIHKPGAPRDGGASAAYLTSGTHIDKFVVNGSETKWGDDAGTFTHKSVRLATPLLPHDSVRLAFDWHYDMSRESGREGMLDSTTFFLAYFYPRVAVYDDYNGWDNMNFTDAQEFYSDFNDYDVTIRVPSNFIVWGTGTLVNASEVLQADAFQRYQGSFTSDSLVHVATAADLAAHRVVSPRATNAWHFTARNIPDMAFNIGDHYLWDASSVVVDEATRRRASVQSAYSASAPDFPYMVGFGRHALDWFSHNWPGVPYPYEKSTIVQGMADMEYPMMVNDNTTPDTTFSKFVVEHEIAHTYFPFYMGINETRYGFMDEGWATTFEHLIGRNDMGVAKAVAFYKQFRVTGWAKDPSPLEDLPIITPEDVLSGVAYGNNAYGKASLGYLAAKDLLGDTTFKRALLAFMDRWHGKHPIPWDFFNTMNDVSGQNLNWFWRDWYFTNAYIDIGVRSVTKTSGGYTITLDNIGGMPAPVDFKLQYSDGTTDTVHQSPSMWASNQKRAVVTLKTRKTLESLQLDGGIWVDADVTNDRWQKK
jgi:hypothetical protein